VIRTGLAALVLAAMLTAFGCGETAKPLTREELIAKADAICRPVIARVDYGKITPARIVRFASQLAAAEERASAQLAKLIPPATMTEEWKQIVHGFQRTAQDFRKLGIPTNAKGEGGVFEPLYEVSRQRAWVARVAGFKDCGQY
jgi:hypothetical protein